MTGKWRGSLDTTGRQTNEKAKDSFRGIKINRDIVVWIWLLSKFFQVVKPEIELNTGSLECVQFLYSAQWTTLQWASCLWTELKFLYSHNSGKIRRININQILWWLNLLLFQKIVTRKKHNYYCSSYILFFAHIACEIVEMTIAVT